jgi:integrase
MAIFNPKYRDKHGKLVPSKVIWYEFIFAGKRIRESAKTTRRTIATEAEKRRKLELERAYAGLPTEKASLRIRTVADALKSYREQYSVNHREKSIVWVKDRTVATERILGSALIPDLTETRMLDFMKQRQVEKAGPRTINMEIAILSRAMGHQWRMLWPKLKKLEERKDIGRALSPDEERAILAEAAKNRSPMIQTFIRIALLTGLRCGEIIGMKWEQIDLEGRTLAVGKAKTAAGTGRIVPLNADLFETLSAHGAWVAQELKQTIQPNWYVFPWCHTVKPVDPTRPATSIKTAWNSVREDAGVNCRLHDLRHTACTKMAEAGTPEATMKALMGHMSTAMVERYSHVRESAKRAAVESLTLASGPVANRPPKDSPKVEESETVQ